MPVYFMAADPDVVLTYVGDPAVQLDEQIFLDALAAEEAAQRRVVSPVVRPESDPFSEDEFYGPDDLPWPIDLTAALGRRVARHIEMRSHVTGFAFEGNEFAGPARIGQHDPEVRRLEAPWRRLVVG